MLAPATAAVGNAPPEPPMAQSPGQSGTLSSDFDTFLRMLTAQLKNQDPLNPLDATEFAAQLASFSSVEQQVITNDLLRDMTAMRSAESLGSVANWVGQTVRSETAVYFDGTPVPLSMRRAPEADQGYLEVRDDSGTLVQRLALAPGQSEIAWVGVDTYGAPLPAGHYHLALDELVQGESLGLTPVSAYQEVAEARFDNGALALILKGGASVAVEAVSGIRPLP